MREILISLAEARLIQPFWSERLLTEWRLAALRNGAEEREMDRLIADLSQRFPEACLGPEPDLEAQISLPDVADAHVLAVAAALAEDRGKASGEVSIVTLNLKDFPSRGLARWQVEAVHPDSLCWLLLSEAPDTVAPLLRDAVIRTCTAQPEPWNPAAIRKQLKRARLSRTGKALEAWLAG